MAAQPRRLAGPIETGQSVRLEGNTPLQARPQFDRGTVDGSFDLPDLTLMLKPTDQQQQDLSQLVIDQQDPSSSKYHRWLTPEQFADRFGLSSPDINRIERWLESRGFQVRYRARGRNWIAFSGTAQLVENAFSTSIHRYVVDGELHFANINQPSIPAVLAGVVAGVRGLHDFVPKPMVRTRVPRTEGLLPDYTSGSYHYLAPDDIATIYDLTPLYSAGIDGTGQSIGVVGQSDINTSDIANFRSIFNLPAIQLNQVLYGSDPGVQSGPAMEAALDLEWIGAVARKATIYYYYAANVFDAVTYAIDQDKVTVISMSYGACESSDSGAITSDRTLAQQASSYGISWLASSGDSGAASCDYHVPQATQGKAVNFPASIPEVTAVGGSEFSEGGGSYWGSSNSANQASALGYIPEKGWNDTALNNSLSSTGGGVSSFYATPAWQTGAGFPNDGGRDVPDISLNSSANHDGYIICQGTTNCPTATWATSPNFTLAGGTSASTPVFAGILALLNHYLVANGLQAKAGLGSINQNLYALAKSNPSAFHDITTGDNIVPCKIGTTNCTTGSFGYTAGVGYDQVTGLGSVDGNNFITAWGGPLAPKITSISPAAPNSSSNTQTVTVSGSGFQSGLSVTVTPPAGANSTLQGAGQIQNVALNSFQMVVALNAAGTWKIQVTNSSQKVSNVFSFTVNQGAQAASATTSAASPVTSTTATLGGTVNPNGSDTHIWFQYGTSSSLSGSTSTAQQDIGAGTANVTVSASLSGLASSTTYYFQVWASNSVGSSSGAIVSFTTSAAAQSPTVSSGSATSLAGTSATLNGTANPNGSDTHAWFNYSTNSSMTGSVATPQQDIGSGTASVATSANISGLAAHTTYYYQAWASNSAGSVQGGILSFTTPGSSPSQLKFTTQPAGGAVGTAIPAVVVQLQDAGGNVVTSSSASVTLTSSPTGVTATIAAVNGVATFSNLVFNGAGSYTLTASSSGLSSVASNSFTITQGQALPDLVITALTSPTTGKPGDLINMSVTIANQGNAAVGTFKVEFYFSTSSNLSSGVVDTGSTCTFNTGLNAGASLACPGSIYIPASLAPRTWYFAAIIDPNNLVAESNKSNNSRVSDSGPIVVSGGSMMPATKLGILRSGVAFLENSNGSGAYQAGIDRYIPNFTGPGGFTAGDYPVAGDWTGDGHAKVGIYRSSTGQWFLDANNNGVFDAGDYTYGFGGVSGDIPVVGDWLGVGKSCIGVFRQGFFWVLDLNCNGAFDGTDTGQDAAYPFGGVSGDVPVVGAWTGGATRVGVVRKYAPAGVPIGNPFYWVLDAGAANAGTAPASHQPDYARCFGFGGLAGDVFVTGDWYNTGASGAGVFRSGLWVLDVALPGAPPADHSQTPITANYGGAAGDVPITAKW
jgi:subtilase family serine protease